MNIFETHPRPWAYRQISGNRLGQWIIFDAKGERTRFVGHHEDELKDLVECVNALNGIENPVQWVSDLTDIQFEHVDLLKEYAKQKQRIAELEQQLAKQPETIKAAISFFTMSNIPLKYVEKWMSGIDPTAPEEQ